jgi:hypothetical protein
MRHSEQSNAILSAHTHTHTPPHTTTTTILSIDSNSQQYKCFNVIHLFRYPCQREREQCIRSVDRSTHNDVRATIGIDNAADFTNLHAVHCILECYSTNQRVSITHHEYHRHQHQTYASSCHRIGKDQDRLHPAPIHNPRMPLPDHGTWHCHFEVAQATDKHITSATICYHSDPAPEATTFTTSDIHLATS